MKFSLIVATYNRAGYLRDTLASLAALRTAESWEAIIVDNNSTDETRAVVEEAAEGAPAEAVADEVAESPAEAVAEEPTESAAEEPAEATAASELWRCLASRFPSAAPWASRSTHP